MGRLLLLCALGLAACYEPDLSAIRFKCDVQSPSCPAGLRCVRGSCQRPDAGRGCLSGEGAQVGERVYACPGTFAPGHAQDLCAPGYGICDGDVRLSGAACGQRGFFASRAAAHRGLRDPPEQALCGAPSSDGDVLLLLGCGALKESSFTLQRACGGLPVALDCERGTQWACNGGIDGAENRTELDSGVLCCWRP